MTDLGTLRSGEYTGENRCWPCTLVNLLIVGVASLLLLVRRRRGGAALVAAVGAGLVYLRGYVVPYTPAFAPELVRASPVPDYLFHGLDAEDERYEAAADERTSLAATDLDGEAVLRELDAAGVVEADGEMLRLTDDVDAAWHAEMERLSDRSLPTLADEIRRDVSRIDETESMETEGREWLVLGEDEVLVARPVGIAELAAYRALGPYLDDEGVRLAGARSLRMFLETCPVCDVELVETDEATCCGSYAKPREKPDEVLACPECDQRLFTFPTE
ncbi:hypothetical protein [Haloarcula litorea]|uniref:hypothetical protein n=1 Tax=Haloarcula litorea TaxID=3032579 RepID=UPI0023E813AA|nr:hypothetical protein [Halomicroarcula sp. GDY20]